MTIYFNVHITFQWQQGAGGICRRQTRVCGYRRPGTDQNNWLFTQHISKDFDTSTYNYPVEIQVELTYRTVGCRTRQPGACKEFFFLHNYITNTQRFPSTVENGFMRTNNYNQLVRFTPRLTSTVYNETNTFNLQSSQTGFYIAIQDTGSCITILRLRVYRYNCPPFQTRLVLYPDAPAPASGSANINIECADNAVVSGSARVTCGSDGRWGPENPVCQCRLGYEDRTTECLRKNYSPFLCSRYILSLSQHVQLVSIAQLMTQLASSVLTILREIRLQLLSVSVSMATSELLVNAAESSAQVS